jgi:hypothetical protein
LTKKRRRIFTILAIALPVLCSPIVLHAADVIPPSVPSNLVATVPTCGQVNLSWSASTDDLGGSGLKAYLIHRSDGLDTTIGAARTTFSDANYVRSSYTLTYTVTAIDNAGNKSAASNSITVTTQTCPISSGEQIAGDAYEEALGKAIASSGYRDAVLYRKMTTQMNLDTWIYIRDDDTGRASQVLLHAFPGYAQTESDYLFTSATELWTLSYDGNNGGHLIASQYKLNGSPVTSATLVSTKSLGDGNSRGMSVLRLNSGALMFSWNEETFSYRAGNLTTGYAYRSPTGNWSLSFPVTFPNSSGIVKSSMTMAQHPADGSIWAFVKRDSYSEIGALHFTESANSFVLDWIQTDFISQAVDGVNGPEGEFPFLTAVSDSTRNAILLAYQSNHDQSVFTDPLYGSSNSIFLKQTYAAVAQIDASGTKTFIPFQAYLERCMQFAMSVASDGTIWLIYQPINTQSLTWNEVYARSYFSGGWSGPALVGYNYNTYNVASGARDPGLMIARKDQPQVAFLVPDQKVHTFSLSSSAATPPGDTTPPTASITSPTAGAILSGSVNVMTSDSDNTGVAQVDLVVDGAKVATSSTAPFGFVWNSSASGSGSHALQAIAHDMAGNLGYSTVVTVSVATVDSLPPTVSITNPANGSVVARNSTASITAAASDNVGVTKVEFYVGGSLVSTSLSVPYTVAWKVPPKNNATYTIKAVAYDAAGNTASATSTVQAK